MSYTISKEFAFSASHRLSGLPDDHQCARLHGHNYVVKVQLASNDLDTTGFVLDYGALAPVKELIDRKLDHRHLNFVMAGNPTAENLARWLTHEIRTRVPLPDGVTVSVGVSETPKTWAWWTP